MNNPLNENILLNLVLKRELSIDDQGRIWSSKTGRRVEHRTSQGYLQVRKMIQGKQVYCGAHRLIWRYFKGPIPAGLTINHRNGKKADNRPENLEVSTYSEQAIHARKILGKCNENGERNPAHKLTNQAIQEILAEKEAIVRERKSRHGHRMWNLATKYGVSYQTIWDVVQGRTWTGLS